VDISDNSGNIVQHYVYSSFGEIKKITNKLGVEISSPIIEHHFTFTGREFDEESNLFFYRARNLDSETGRFIQNDSNKGVLNDPVTFINKHIYTANNPIKYRDPSGKIFVIDDILITMAIGAIVNGAINASVHGGAFNWNAFGKGAAAGATGAAVGYLTFGLGFVASGALAGAASSSMTLLVNGDNFTKKESIFYILGSSLIGGVTGYASSVAVGKVSAGGYGYKTTEALSKIISNGNGITASLTGEIIFSTIPEENKCNHNGYESKAECF
jgi:RHS repeat-associated protein